MALHPAISAMLEKYHCQSQQEYKSALKEIIQEVALLGLSRHNFFDKASFYGGTALRIAHNLERFSEDLDFELNSKIENFDLHPFLNGIREELKTYGLNFHTEKIKKSKKNSDVESAFIKGNTLEHFLLIEGLEDPQKGINKNDLIKIKLEVDMDPPEVPSAKEVRYHQNPIPFAYKILDLPSLFSGKLHAVLCREWGGGRVKGRDLYDYLWYKKNNVVPNFPYLQAKLIQSGHWSDDKVLNEKTLRTLLESKFKSINWEQAKSDVSPFIRDPFALEVWSEAFFITTARL